MVSCQTQVSIPLLHPKKGYHFMGTKAWLSFILSFATFSYNGVPFLPLSICSGMFFIDSVSDILFLPFTAFFTSQ
jgi:hypothetical protein